MRDTPDWAALPPATPAAIRTLLKRCLEKDPRKRAAHISIARLEIDDALSGGSADTASASLRAAAPRGARARELAAWGLAALSVVAAAWLALRPGPAPEPPPPVGRFSFEIPSTGGAIGVALSADGAHIAVQSSRNPSEGSPIFVRRLDSPAFVEVPGSEGLRLPAWSRDDTSLLGFTRPGLVGTTFVELRRIDVTTGQALTVTRLPDGLILGSVADGGSGALLVAVAGQPLHVINAENDTPRPLGTLDPASRELEQQLPVFLPDGRRFFYTSVRQGSQFTTMLGSLESDTVRELPALDGRVFWANDHYVLFRRDTTIFAQAYSLDPLALQGRPVHLADDATVFAGGARQPSAASGSVLAYRKGTRATQQFTWLARDGRPLGTVGPEGAYSTFDLSRDGSRVVVSRLEGAGNNLWMLDTVKGTFSRVTTGASSDVDPRWSPDGRTVIFGSTRDPARSPFRAGVVGQEPERVFQFDGSGKMYSNDDWSADGQWLLYHDAVRPVLQARRLDRPDEPPVVVARALTGIVDQARMSHDGTWVAYNSTESGRSEMYVVPFPPTGDRWQVSVDGGAQPLWRRDGRELFYLAPDGALMAVGVKPAPQFEAGTAVRLLQSPLLSVGSQVEQYAAAPDGSKFLFPASIEGRQPDAITVVTNWRSLLSRPRE